MKKIAILIVFLAFSLKGEINPTREWFGNGPSFVMSRAEGKELFRHDNGNDLMVFVELDEPYCGLKVAEFHFSTRGLWKIRFIAKDETIDKQNCKKELVKRFRKMGFFGRRTDGGKWDDEPNGNCYSHQYGHYIGIGTHVKFAFCDFERKNLKPKFPMTYRDLSDMMKFVFEQSNKE